MDFTYIPRFKAFYRLLENGLIEERLSDGFQPPHSLAHSQNIVSQPTTALLNELGSLFDEDTYYEYYLMYSFWDKNEDPHIGLIQYSYEEIYDKKINLDRVEKIFFTLPFQIFCDGLNYGWNDTVVKDNIYVFLTETGDIYS